MADQEKVEFTIVVDSCVEKNWSDGSTSFEIKGLVDGQPVTYYGKEAFDPGPQKAFAYNGKKSIYKVKERAQNAGGPPKRDYTYERREKALQAAATTLCFTKPSGEDVVNMAIYFEKFLATGQKP